MEHPEMNILQCGEIMIAASCETDNAHEKEGMAPTSFLIFVEKGRMLMETDKGTWDLERGSYALVRKYTKAKFTKTFAPSEGAFKSIIFALTNEFLRKVIHEIEIPKELDPVAERCVLLTETVLLKGLMQSIKGYVEEGAELDTRLVEIKTKEALIALIHSAPRLAAVFREYALAERADISEFMNYNYQLNIPLATLALQSGRSLSTFKREFKQIFNETPHRWIMKMRLSKAHELLALGKKRPSEVYTEVGFEDLAHFSKAFKKQFNINPSQVLAF